METNELVRMLATGAGPADTHVASRRYSLALGFGVLGATLLMLAFLGIRADLAEAALWPQFWLKVGFVALLVIGSLFAVLRVSRPGVKLAKTRWLILTPLVAMWAIAALALMDADPAQRPRMFLGDTWKTCPFLIAMLSAPVFVGVIWAMKGLAPTQPRLAGFMAGLLSGTTAALVYCLHCPESQAPFIAFWYVLGMLIPAGVGAMLGRLVLRW